MVQSWSILQPVLRITPSPILDETFTTTPGITTVPAPKSAYWLITAEKYTNVTTGADISDSQRSFSARMALLPIATTTPAKVSRHSTNAWLLPATAQLSLTDTLGQASSKKTTSSQPQHSAISATTLPCPLAPRIARRFNCHYR